MTVELDEGATVALLLKTLEIEMAPEYLLVLLGQQRIDLEHPLYEGDEVQLFPPISGG